MRRLLLPLALLAAPADAAGPGPDLIIGDINAVANFTSTGAVDGKRAYAFGIAFCNLGSQPADWTNNSPNHPVATQNLYRIASGRIDHVGMSWVHHEFFPLQQNLCSACTPATGSFLGVGCSTVTTSGITGSQSFLASRSEINAATGAITVPSPTAGTTGNAIFKRLQIAESDLSTPNALYFAEVAAVHLGDAASGNNANNSSFRRVLVSQPTFNLTFSDATQRAATILDAWRAHANGANQPDPFIRITPVDITGDGRIYFASRAHQVSATTWQYTYAIYNATSDLGAASIIVRHPVSALPMNPTFNAPAHHSGEPYSNTPWLFQTTPAAVAWSTETFAANPNANAVRWSSLYTFSFQMDTPPVFSSIQVYPFKPGGPSAPGVLTPEAIVPGPPACAGDANGDNLVNFADLNHILSNFGQSGVALPGDVNADQTVNFADLNLALSNFALPC